MGLEAEVYRKIGVTVKDLESRNRRRIALRPYRSISAPAQPADVSYRDVVGVVGLKCDVESVFRRMAEVDLKERSVFFERSDEFVGHSVD